MFGRSATSTISDIVPDIRALERTMQSLERRLERVKATVPDGAARGVDQAGSVVASTLDLLADRFRDGALGGEAIKFGAEATKLGDHAMRRLSREMQAHPLVTLAVAAGVGILVGVLSRRR
jgi:ElaB/YqjD/DUF883 family membrane-anchored ribosome-binding protein